MIGLGWIIDLIARVLLRPLDGAVEALEAGRVELLALWAEWDL